MARSVKIDMMHGPLSYLGGDGMVEKLGACGEYHFAGAIPFINCQSFEAYVNPPHYIDPPYGECLLDSIISGEIAEILKSSDNDKECNISIKEYIHSKALNNLVNAQRGFNKRIKNWIEDKEEFSVIYFFHPIDIAENSEEYKEIQAEAKKKKIKLVSIYHKLKDFKLLSNKEIYQIIKDYYDSDDFDDVRMGYGFYYGGLSAEKYRQMIKDYEGLKEVNE